ncbi:MAG: arylsulfatase A-like enzyme [Verrucomicrobiales bacterium]|jgi:arylsulfatase A-like enzyme
MRKWIQILCWFLVLVVPAFAQSAAPNIVLVMTDDQGYGDLGFHGNPVIKTPHVDALAAESTSLDDYHVAPTCSPTRCALLTGHWTNRTGVWHTVNGRSMLRENEVTLAQMLKDAGYETGMFGKWHLGDNYPYRAEDRGFTEVYRHGGGGVGQTPDVWDNAYFDGSYFHNGKVVAAEGFCTDVFFEKANDFIKVAAENKKPFLAYIVPNAPHGPLHAPQKYLDLYKDQSDGIAAFYGMITNIDDNVGQTRKLLEELGIADNTIFIFTTDNGTATGDKLFNAGMRGKKGSAYDGGHRVPFFLHWPAGGMQSAFVQKTLTHTVDVVPTLLELTGAAAPTEVKFDGVSIAGLLDQSKAENVSWPERFVITDSQRVRDPIKWKSSSVMSERFRLINGKELYDIDQDPGQKNDIAADHSEQVEKMRAFYEAWWAELEPTFARTTEIYLGHGEHPVVSLTGHDWIQESLPPWNQRHIRDGHVAKNRKHAGHWAVKVLETGDYRVSMRRWPVEANIPICAGLPAGDNVPGASKAFRAVEGKALKVKKSVLRIDDKDVSSKPVDAAATEVSFEVSLQAGSHRLAPLFLLQGGAELGAYYTIVTRLP